MNRRDAEDNLNFLKLHGTNKNAVSLCYNLLRLYYIKAYKDVKFSSGDSFYDNGHVKIMAEQIFPGFDGYSMDTAVSFTTQCGYASGPIGNGTPPNSLLWFGVLSDKAWVILRSAFSEWTQKAPFGIAHSSPMLADTIHINAWEHPNIAQTPGWDCITTADIREVIMHVVNDNELYSDFDYAYMMLTQLLVSPIPRSAEAAAWLVGVQDVAMPKLRVFNGHFPMMFYGAPSYALDKDWMGTFRNWTAKPLSALHHSIAVNEAVYVELGNVARIRDGTAVTRSNLVQLYVSESPMHYTGMIFDLTLVSMRYGKDKQMCYPISAGLTRNNFSGAEVNIKVPITITDIEYAQFHNAEETEKRVGEATNLLVTNMTAALYPILTMGVNVDPYYSNSFDAEIALSLYYVKEGIVFHDAQTFCRFMSMTSLMGYKVKARDLVMNKWVTNWAGNASGRFLYSDTNNMGVVHYLVKHEDIERRNKWIYIGFHGDVLVSFKMTGQRLRMYNGSQALRFWGPIIEIIKASD